MEVKADKRSAVESSCVSPGSDGEAAFAYNVRGLPQGWYFITVRPATEADLKTDDEVNN